MRKRKRSGSMTAGCAAARLHISLHNRFLLSWILHRLPRECFTVKLSSAKAFSLCSKGHKCQAGSKAAASEFQDYPLELTLDVPRISFGTEPLFNIRTHCSILISFLNDRVYTATAGISSMPFAHNQAAASQLESDRHHRRLC